jgi:hypothetical protein
MTAVEIMADILHNRELWIKALLGESKKYRQHRNDLASTNFQSFCCLGVALEAVPALGAERMSAGCYRNTLAVDGFDRVQLAVSLGRFQRQLLGISEGMMRFLMDLNDSRRAPLAVIGEVVKHLPIWDGTQYTEWESYSWYNIPAIHELLTDYQKVYD